MREKTRGAGFRLCMHPSVNLCAVYESEVRNLRYEAVI
jgi:hypothetical protein